MDSGQNEGRIKVKRKGFVGEVPTRPVSRPVGFGGGSPSHDGMRLRERPEARRWSKMGPCVPEAAVDVVAPG